ncbi:MAG: hypothetical protein M1834_003219 [Cirrosporium novae-zelandiae]|nr:MAG: hypothetical protein M1834_003219 [Cirrosporium novae-zelandiae]
MAQSTIWKHQATHQLGTQQYQHQREKVKSRNRRRQHRSCDQCRKGKRACDVVVLDGLVSPRTDIVISERPDLSTDSAPSWPQNNPLNESDGTDIDRQSVDNVVSLGPCSNCAKTGKNCTLEWLRSMQDVISRRRKRNSVEKRALKRSERSEEPAISNGGTREPVSTIPSGSPLCSLEFSQNIPLSPSSFLNYPLSPPLDDQDLLPSISSDAPSLVYSQVNANSSWAKDPEDLPMTHVTNLEDTMSETGFPYREDVDKSQAYSAELILPDLISNPFASDNRELPVPRSRRCSSHQRMGSLIPQSSTSGELSSQSGFGQRLESGVTHPPDVPRAFIDPSPYALQERLATSANRSFLADGLIRIYHDSMENALSCWLTERTCPYNVNPVPLFNHTGPDPNEPMMEEWGPNWSNRICQRVCHLDRASSAFRDRSLTQSEDRAASRALHMAIMAFATQWAQSSQRSSAEFSSFMATIGQFGSIPATSMGSDPTCGRDSASDPDSATFYMSMEFDRSIQETFWHQARRALQDTAHIESFRVIFAHLVFSLTQRPVNIDLHIRAIKMRYRNRSIQSENAIRHAFGCPSMHGVQSNHSTFTSRASRPDTTVSKLAELDQLVEIDGPPVFLETALRQVFSFRYKLERIEKQSVPKTRNMKDNGMMNHSASTPVTSGLLSRGDRKTFDLLFWLGIMFDTLSAAMHKRPLVVSDEDSDILDDHPWNTSQPTYKDVDEHLFNSAPSSYRSTFIKGGDSKLWGKFFLEQNRLRHSEHIPRWPCSYEDAAATLSDAAPVKVLLFRKVTHLQTLLSRKVRHERLEEGIQDALKVYQHWNKIYGQFILDCISNHNNLPPRIQSWYVVLVGHWHLAALLLADIIETIDEEMLGLESQRNIRGSSSLVPTLRKKHAYAMADLGKCSCPRHDSSFPQAPEFHFALNKGALLTEPWTVVLIRSFGKAGFTLLDPVHFFHQPGPRENMGDLEAEIKEAKARCEYCIEALWHLGKKSDMAFLAATALSSALQDISGTSSTEPFPNNPPCPCRADFLNLGIESTTSSQHASIRTDFIAEEPFQFSLSDVPNESFLDTLENFHAWG